MSLKYEPSSEPLHMGADLAQDAALAARAILRQCRDERCLHPITDDHLSVIHEIPMYLWVHTAHIFSFGGL